MLAPSGARQGRLAARRVPRPLVAEPQRRQDVEGGRLGPPVADDDPHQDVGRGRLGVVDLDDPVAVVIEDAGVEQLVLGLELRAPGVLLDQVVVREGGLRVVVAPAQPGAARQGVEVPPVLLDVLAVVALRVGQAEHPLLEDRVLAVPQREREAQPVEDVGDAGHPVLVPAVGARPGVIVRERVPGVAVGAVVLADRAPGPLAQVRAPLIPGARLDPAVLRVAGVLHPLALGTAVTASSSRATDPWPAGQPARPPSGPRRGSSGRPRPPRRRSDDDVVGRGQVRVDDAAPAVGVHVGRRQLEVERLPVGVEDQVERAGVRADRQGDAVRIVAEVRRPDLDAAPLDRGVRAACPAGSVIGQVEHGAIRRRSRIRPFVNRRISAWRSTSVQSNQLVASSWQ